MGGGTLTCLELLTPYDTDGDGHFCPQEFSMVLETLGFGAIAEELRRKIDLDGSGVLCKYELLRGQTHGSYRAYTYVE